MRQDGSTLITVIGGRIRDRGICLRIGSRVGRDIGKGSFKDQVDTYIAILLKTRYRLGSLGL